MDAGQPYPPTTAAGCGINIRIIDTIFWANAAWVGGAMRIVNTHPMFMEMDRVVYADNTAIVGHDWGTWFYANMLNSETKRCPHAFRVRTPVCFLTA